MNVRAGSGWQTVLADLSLILFMVMASAVGQTPPPVSPQTPLHLPALGEPVAVWRAGPGAPSLTSWLAVAGTDAKLRLTIVAPAREEVLAQALAKTAGRPARIILETEGQVPLFAALTYDRPATLARALQNGMLNQPPPEAR